MSCKGFKIVFLVLLASSSFCSAQTTGSISGKVIDSSTKKPAPFLTIFFANTMFGTTSNESGEFKLSNIPNGKYNLTISGVGYKVISQPVEISGTDINQTILVEPEIKLLGEIVVKSRPSDFSKNLKTFKRYFLGTSANASQCQILNIDAIDLQFDNQANILIATAQEPIEIENRALGYKIYYLLQTFKLDNKQSLIILSGIPRFENLKAEKSKKEQQWKRNRDRAYFGSINHFIRCLYFHSTEINHYVVSELKNGTEQKINPDALFEVGSTSEIDFHGMLKVVFENENEETNYSRQSRFQRPQTSYMQFGEKNIRIYKNGYFEDPLNVVFSGYMGWEKMAELVPVEYEPYNSMK